jgi:hypothetical protein
MVWYRYRTYLKGALTSCLEGGCGRLLQLLKVWYLYLTHMVFEVPVSCEQLLQRKL